MKFLITGDCGFIGGNLAKSLISEGHRILGYDNNSSSSVYHRIDGVEFVPILTPAITGLDGIFHLGMASSSPMYKKNPYVIEDSIRTTLSVLELAKINKCPVVYASSSSLYNGNPPPYNEKMEIKVTDFYTETRLFVERLFTLHDHLFEIPSAGLRFFSVFGPRDQYKGKYANNITQFALSLMKGETPIVFGNGSQTRDFVHVDFVVQAMKRSMNLLLQDSESFIVNVGSGKCLTFKELIKRLKDLTNSEIDETYIPNPIDNYVKDTLADTTFMKKLLGIEYNTFDKDLKNHIKYLKRWKNAKG